MKLRGKLLRTVPEQREGGDSRPVNPRTVMFDEDAWYALRPNFDVASEQIGRVQITRALDGSLDALAEIYVEQLRIEIPFVVRFAIGTLGGTTKDGVVEGGRLTQIALTAVNTDRGMPLARVE